MLRAWNKRATYAKSTEICAGLVDVWTIFMPINKIWRIDHLIIQIFEGDFVCVHIRCTVQ